MKTRKMRAAELLERVTNGPAFISHGLGPGVLSDVPRETRRRLEREMQDAYRLWVTSWIVSELKDLVPELRAKEK